LGGGVKFDGKAGAWNDKELMYSVQTNCYYQTETFAWETNKECVPFEPVGNSLVASTSDKENILVAFDIQMNFNFVRPGQVTFKYKKDSVQERMINGEFKFGVDEWIIFSDFDPSKDGWQFKTVNVTEGIHNLQWIYTKYNSDVAKDMSASVQLVEI
jgi:hypothetical protein